MTKVTLWIRRPFRELTVMSPSMFAVMWHCFCPCVMRRKKGGTRGASGVTPEGEVTVLPLEGRSPPPAGMARGVNKELVASHTTPTSDLPWGEG